MEAFGIGQEVKIGMPNESKGTLDDWKNWQGRTRYTTMFGQGWSATTVQLAQMMSIIANDGKLTPLHIVDSVIDQNGLESKYDYGQTKRVISSTTSKTMLQMMQGVTNKESTAPTAAIEGYNVAGKTGTGQIYGKNGALEDYVSTFVGTFPAEDPEIAISVVVYGSKGQIYGGQVAAPVFSEMGKYTGSYLHIPSSTVPLYKYPWTPSEMTTQRRNEE